jgi:hypothetical protein
VTRIWLKATPDAEIPDDDLPGMLTRLTFHGPLSRRGPPGVGREPFLLISMAYLTLVPVG